MQGLEPMPAALNVLLQSLNQVSVQAQKFRTSATVMAVNTSMHKTRKVFEVNVWSKMCSGLNF